MYLSAVNVLYNFHKQQTFQMTCKKKKTKRKKKIKSKPDTALKGGSCFLFVEGITDISH